MIAFPPHFAVSNIPDALFSAITPFYSSLSAEPCGLRKSDTDLQEKWNAAAKEKAQTNALARDLHRMFTKVDWKAPPSPGVGVTPEAIPLDNCNFTVAWLGLTFTANRLIGSGTYGRVYVVEGQGCQFAAKILKRPHDGDDVHGLCDLRDIVREANIHVRSASPFVVPCVGLGRQVDEESSPACLLMEVCEGGSLWNALQGNAATISFKQRLAWSVQIAAGLCHLHAQKVIHLDLKLDNILLASNPSHPYSRAMINDFGLAKIMGANDEVTVTMNQAYAARYRPPECTMFIEETEAWSCLRFFGQAASSISNYCLCVCLGHVTVMLVFFWPGCSISICFLRGCTFQGCPQPFKSGPHPDS